MSLILGSGLGWRGQGLQHLGWQATSPRAIDSNTMGIHFTRGQVSQLAQGLNRRIGGDAGGQATKSDVVGLRL